MARAYDDPLYRKNRRLILAGNPPCFRCGAPATTAHHVIPVSKGGTNTLAGLVPSCAKCNYSIGNKVRHTWKQGY